MSGVQAGALLLAMLAAFPFIAGATDAAPVRPQAAVTAPRAAGFVVAQAPVGQAPAAAPTPLLTQSPPPAPPPAIIQLPTTLPAPAAQKAAPPGPAHPSLVAPASEKAPDRVISAVEVDRQVNTGQTDDPEDGDRDGFFDTASEEVEKGKDGSFARLTNPIDKFINYFTNRGRKRMELYLARSGKYRDMMRGILAKYGLPEDLIYLALIESGFSPKAYSHAKAAGPWQFIAGTGRRYGLRIDWWADERRDAEKSTHAAASYLKDLYGMFDSWPLAAAAYNAGEGKIIRAVNRYKSDDFAELIRYGYLKQETKDYVPKMLAALTIAKEPEKYGFSDIVYEEPLNLESVTVPGGTDLVETARILEIPYEDIREWNPELRRFCTPPNRDEYVLRLSAEAAARAVERMDEIRTRAKVTFLQHNVRKRETLEGLAAKYDTTPAILRELNGLRQDSLSRVSRLVIPVTGLSGEEAVPGKEIAPDQILAAHQRAEESRRRSRTAAASSGKVSAKESVRVRKGETLTSIAKEHGVSAAELARANGLSVKAKVKAGTRLVVPGGGSVETKIRKKTVRHEAPVRKTVRHKVRRGASTDKIARAPGIE
jgi:membrane-bound lytic murein transglycosylase D